MLERVKRATQRPQKTSTDQTQNEPDSRRTVAAVNRAIDILLAFQPGESRISLALLAERTGLYKSTILRLLQTLEGRNMVTRIDEHGYRLGPSLLHLGTVYQKSFRLDDIVMPQLANLTEITGESASFFVSDGDSRLCLFRNEPPQIVRHTVNVGQSLPMGRGASGKVLTSFSAGAGSAPAAVFRQIPIESIGNNPLDISTIAGPVFGHEGRLVGAVSISGPTSRFDKASRRKASSALIQALKTLTSKLGGDATVFAA